MENAGYVSIARQIGLLNNFDLTVNNIANSNTSGYKKSSLLFKEYVDINKNKNISFSQDSYTLTDHKNGSMEKTGSVFDLSIAKPKHYFAVLTNYGVKYTKDGNFRIDNENKLVNSDLFPVLDINNQPITINNNYKDIAIGNTGNIIIDNKLYKKLGVFELPNDSLIIKTGKSLLKYQDQNITASNSSDLNVIQGFIENSNVESITEMSSMLNISRTMEEQTNVLNKIYKIFHNLIEILIKYK